jgi:signal transduction histidine kinase
MPRRGDILLALGLSALGVFGLVAEPVSSSSGVTRAWDALGVALVLVMCLPLTFRRRHPVAVLVVSAAALLVAGSRGYAIGLGQVGTVVALASAAYFTNRAVTVRIAAFVTGILTVAVIVSIPSQTDASVAGAIATVGSGLLAVWVGDLLRETRESQRRLGELMVEQDRMRIAREVHDVVGHSLVGIALQARAARRRLERDPARAAAAIDEIDELAAAALAETRQAVGVIRADMAPQPTLDELDELVAHLQTPDMQVRLERDAGNVPVLIQSTAYRIVQEALSNVAKHARPASATVSVRRNGDALAVEVRDNGTGSGARSDGGHGLQGMRERAELCGGSLDAGPAPDGGWVVSARLPIA